MLVLRETVTLWTTFQVFKHKIYLNFKKRKERKESPHSSTQERRIRVGRVIPLAGWLALWMGDVSV